MYKLTKPNRYITSNIEYQHLVCITAYLKLPPPQRQRELREDELQHGVRLSIYLSIYLSFFISFYLSIYLCIYLCISMYVHIYIYIYIYIHAANC